jgi:hypothetical protein
MSWVGERVGLVKDKQWFSARDKALDCCKGSECRAAVVDVRQSYNERRPPAKPH